jgi:hypothetical protein
VKNLHDLEDIGAAERVLVRRASLCVAAKAVLMTTKLLQSEKQTRERMEGVKQIVTVTSSNVREGCAQKNPSLDEASTEKFL